MIADPRATFEAKGVGVRFTRTQPFVAQAPMPTAIILSRNIVKSAGSA